MPVVTISEDWVAQLNNPDRKANSLIDPAWIYYRPAYTLPEYEKDAAAWAKAASGTLERDGPYMIPLAGVWDRDWADLGHPLLDQAKPAEKLTDEQKEILSSLTVNLTYLQEPYSYEVNTGDWGVHDFRHFQLPSTAPEWLVTQVCRTSKMIFAWGIEIEIVIPDLSVAGGKDGTGSPSGGDAISEAALRNLTLTALDLPLKPEASASNKLVFQSVARPVPLLLGVLADVV